MTSLKSETVRKVVMGWNLMFPGNRDNGQLAFLSAKCMEHCLSVFSDYQFLIAAKLVEQDSRFFPTIADLMAVKDVVYQRSEQVAMEGVALLTEETDLTEEEIERNLKKMEIINAQLSGKMSLNDAIRKQEELLSCSGEVRSNNTIRRKNRKKGRG